MVIQTLNALHLASAQIFSEAEAGETVLVYSHDSGMNRCAIALGFAAPFHQERQNPGIAIMPCRVL